MRRMSRRLRLRVLQPASPTRRELLQWSAAALAASSLPTLACYDESGTAITVVKPGFFTPDERRAFAALANAILPPDGDPGGADLGAVAYIERLLTAFDSDPPALFAGGPYSGRQPFADEQGAPSTSYPPNDFTTFQPLDRVTEAAWRLRIFGSQGLPGGAPNEAILGPVVGLRDQLRKGLADAIQTAPAPLDTMAPADLASFFSGLAPSFRDLLIELVSEAAFAAPEYGGNVGLAGWTFCHFEGDTQPLGYSLYDEVAGTYHERPEAPMSTPNPGPDPDPMDADTRAFITEIVGFTGGRVYK
jgi:hypothetical protein